MVIYIVDHVERCYSNNDGEIVLSLLKTSFENDEDVTLSFKGINSITSSFTNTAFIDLLKDYNFEYIKRKLRFIDTNKNINNMIKSRFSFEVSRMEKDLLSV